MDKKVHEIYCNSCGKKIETTDNIKREDYLSIKKEWGYFSKKDGEIHSIFCVNPVMIYGRSSLNFL